jgi:hypothetical protein
MDNFSFRGKNCPQNIYLVKFTFPDDKITWGIDRFWCNFIDQIFLFFPRCVLIPLNVLWVNSVLGVNATNTHVWQNQLFLATETPKNVITLDVLTMAQLVSCFSGDSSWFFRSLWSISVWGAKVHLSRHIYPYRHQKHQGNRSFLMHFWGQNFVHHFLCSFYSSKCFMGIISVSTKKSQNTPILL